MFSRDYAFSAAGLEGGSPNREAVDGFSAIAFALDHGIDEAGINGTRIVDAVAIGLGWLALAAIIFYPALQLAAIATCAAFMCMRSFTSYVLDAAGSLLVYSRGFLPDGEQLLRVA
jgi:hypothetical protein